MSLNQNRAALFGSKGSAGSSAPQTKSSTISSTTTATKPTTTITAPPVAATPVSKTAGMKLPDSTKRLGVMSMDEKRRKVDEAKNLSERATNALKTSVFSWNPDYLVAAPLYEQSAELYRSVGELDSALGLMLRAAECHEKYNAIAASALAQIKAAAIAKEKGDDKKSIKILESAAEAWAIHGDLVRYGDTLHKVAIEVRTL